MNKARPTEIPEPLLRRIAEAIRDVQFGCVQVVIHDSKIVRIERSEKIRVEMGADLQRGGET